MSEQLKSGEHWLGRLQGALVPVATFMSLNRYGAVPDTDDRVSDAQAALVEGSQRFKPQPGRDGIGYYLQYVLSYVAGALRNGAQTAKDWSDEAAVFSDIDPEQFGIERLWDTSPGSPGEEPDEAQFVLNNGKVASTLEIVDLIAGHEERRRIAAKLLSVQADDPGLRVRLLRELDAIGRTLQATPRWAEDVPGQEPVVTHDLEAVTVAHNGVQSEISAAELRQMVEDASRTAVVWTPEEAAEEWYETDTPWPTWVAADQTRSYRSPYMDDNVWPEAVGREQWLNLLGVWAFVGHAGDVLDALVGGETEITGATEPAVEAMEALAETLADEPDGSVRTVARALARRLYEQGHRTRTEDGQDGQQALFEAVAWSLGVDGSRGWSHELPSADGLRRAVEAWVEKVAGLRGLWPSQAAAIKALVLFGASPREARQAGRAAYASRHGG